LQETKLGFRSKNKKKVVFPSSFDDKNFTSEEPEVLHKKRAVISSQHTNEH